MCDTEPLWEGEYEARLPEESHKELDEVHDAVVLGEGDLLRGRGVTYFTGNMWLELKIAVPEVNNSPTRLSWSLTWTDQPEPVKPSWLVMNREGSEDMRSRPGCHNIHLL